ncbi:MAG: MYXO-CTERM sorting domain-containing protein, partial [Phycisphaerales bacterium]
YLAGTYTGVSGNFNGFCLELTETIQEPNAYTYKVVPLSVAPDGDGLFTFPLGAAGADLLSELWGRWHGTLDISNANDCAAFQIAIWEIVYDANLILNNAGDSLIIGAPAPVLTQAQFYLDSLDGTGPRAVLEAFTHPTAQDQVIPTPGALALLGMGGLAAVRRRRR